MTDRLRRATAGVDWTPVGVALAAMAGLSGLGVAQLVGLPALVEPRWVRRLVARAGPFAPLVFVALQALQVVVAPLPGQLLAGVGGYLFGGPAGAAYSLLGTVIGSYLVFLAAARHGRPLVARLLAPETRERFEAFGAANGPLTLFVCFLLPVFPDDVLCVVAGLWDVRPRTFIVLLVVGRAPSFLAAAYAGTSVYEGAFGRLGLLLGVATLLAFAVHLFRDRIEAILRVGGGSGDA